MKLPTCVNSSYGKHIKQHSSNGWSYMHSTEGSTAVYYRSPDKSLHPIRFIWAWHPAGVFYPLLSSMLFYINGQKWQKTAFPATLTPCVCLLTQPQNLISHMSDHAMQNKWCQPQSKELLRLNLNLFRCSCWDEQLLHRLSAEFIIAIAIKNVRYLHLKWQH